MSDDTARDTYHLDIALDPLAILHSEGWGPDDVEVTDGEVRFIYSLKTETDQ